MSVSSPKFHIAQINIAVGKAALTDPLMADFVRQIDEINALAEQTPGFVWRLKADDGGGSSYLQVYPDPRMLINMSVWESIEALHQYVYRSHHVGVFRDRGKWFDPMKTPSLAMWWIPVGEIPTIEEGKRRLELIERLGPTPEAFTFKQRFEPPAALGHSV